MVTRALQPAHCLLLPARKVGRGQPGCGRRSFNPAGPCGDLASIPRDPTGGRGTGGQGVHGMQLPICPPPISRSGLRPLPDVQECEARGCPWWGEGERCLSGCWARGLLPPYAQSHPTLPRGEGGGGSTGGPCAPSPALPSPPQGQRGELRRSGRQLDWEGSRWPGARLISC